MSKSITLTYCGVTASGATVKEAKANATSKIQHALRQNYAPRLVTVGNMSAVITCDPQDGYGYSLLTDEDGQLREEIGYPQGRADDYYDCHERCLHHLGQLAMDSEHAFVADDLPEPCRRNARLVSELLYMACFHRAYWHAQRVMQLPEHECHRWACDHQHEFKTRTWQGEPVQAACVA